MKSEHFLDAEEVSKLLDMSKPYAYKIIQQMNRDLASKGYITIRGKVSKKYLEEHFYGLTERK